MEVKSSYLIILILFPCSCRVGMFGYSFTEVGTSDRIPIIRYSECYQYRTKKKLNIGSFTTSTIKLVKLAFQKSDSHYRGKMAYVTLILYILRFLRVFPEFLKNLVSCWRSYCFRHFCCCSSPFCVYVCDVHIVFAVVQPTLVSVKVVSSCCCCCP